MFGCARAPADDPKLQVSQSDLSAVNLPGQPYAAPSQPYAPAGRAGAPQYPPSIYGGSVGLSAAGAQPAPVTGASSPAAPPPLYSQLSLPAHARAPFQLSQKSRAAYIVLGILLGALGIHNFYAGYTRRAVGQLCLTVLTLGYLAVVAWIWALVEICVVTKDGAGLDFN